MELIALLLIIGISAAIVYGVGYVAFKIARPLGVLILAGAAVAAAGMLLTFLAGLFGVAGGGILLVIVAALAAGAVLRKVSLFG